MQLLQSRAAPTPEFASLSLLLKKDVSGDQISCCIGEPLIMPSPVSTTSQAMCINVLKELHQYLNSIFHATRPSKENQISKMALEFFQEDDKLLNEMQVFRPLSCHGLGLNFRVIRERSLITKFVPLVFNASKSGTSSDASSIESETTAIVLCVGFAGYPSALAMSSLHFSLAQRIGDCLNILSKSGSEDAGARSLLSTLLLTEDEDRLTNSMASGVHRTLYFEIEEGAVDKKGIRKKKNHATLQRESEVEAGLTVNTADHARIMVERLAVLSVSESDTIFRKYEAKATAGDKSSTKSRRRKAVGGDADLGNFDYKGEKVNQGTAPSVGRKVPANSTSKALQLKQPKNDTTSRITKAKQSVPPLMANSKDLGRRRASMDFAAPAGRNARGMRRVSHNESNGQDQAPSSWFDGGNGAFGNMKGTDGESTSSSTGKTTPSLSSRIGRNTRLQNNFDPFEGASVTESVPRKSRGTDEESEFGQTTNLDQMFEQNSYPAAPMDDELITTGARSARSSYDGDSGARVQVNVALNEDLTCFYKLSKMSSCSVEGVVQVQVKSNLQANIPFFLLIRDPSKHIQSLQENKKFAEIASPEPTENIPHHRFTVNVPRADNYFPVMRYKCGTELRPVPIRVQTRVRLEEGYWRVALQISSNPHNEDNLTDLTIIMGVPPVVKGESLTTSPPGGVWNASKRSVIWCVSELGGGEKFQLQARFEIEPDAVAATSEKPKFPVLVRCQCMYAQLSDVEVEVGDIRDLFPADVKMKLARRFRLSHRERP